MAPPPQSGDAHASDPAVGGIARVRIGGSILSSGKILAQRCYPAFDMAWRSIRSRSFAQRSREISAAGSGTECGCQRRRIEGQRRLRSPPSAPITPVANHRGCDAQLPCDLRQRPTAARQQGNRIAQLTTTLAGWTPSRSPRSLARCPPIRGDSAAGRTCNKFRQCSRNGSRLPRVRSIKLRITKSEVRLSCASQSRRCGDEQHYISG
jgi:hypothetical protein